MMLNESLSTRSRAEYRHEKVHDLLRLPKVEKCNLSPTIQFFVQQLAGERRYMRSVTCPLSWTVAQVVRKANRTPTAGELASRFSVSLSGRALRSEQTLASTGL